MARRRNLIQLFIDRVGNVNIFNLIKEDEIPITGKMRTVIDDDLIEEYFQAISRIYNVFVAEHAGEKFSEERVAELQEICAELYNQLVPDSIKNYFSQTTGRYIHIRPDQETEKIPWELLFDGEKFLSEKFYMGRGQKCNTGPKYRASLTMPVKMLIIVDPSATLEWAEHEAKELEKQLKNKFTSEELVVEMFTNKEITKLKLMNKMRGKDIIHFIGHSVDEDNENAGWKIGKKKLLKVREIENANITSVLVFSHSCRSAGRVAKAFLKTGVRHFIGCRQDVLETEDVISFVSRFYNSVLHGHALGRAFTDAMHKYNATGLLSFNYVLFSDPKLSIQTFSVETGKNSFLKPEDVIKKFPYPVAETYRKFLVAQKKKRFDLCARELENALLWTMRLFSFIIITDLERHSLLGKNLQNKIKHSDIYSWKNFLFSGLAELINLRQELKMPEIAKVFYLQKENIEKMLSWINKFDTGDFEDEELPEFITVFHYLLDSLLLDLIFITRYDFLCFLNDGYDRIYKVAELKSANIKEKEIEIHEHIEKDKVILFDPVEESFVCDMSDFIKCENKNGKIIARFMKSKDKNEIQFEEFK